MTSVHLDFETQSELSVKDVGGWVYTRHPSTRIISAAIAVNDEPPQLVMDWNGFVGDGYGLLLKLASFSDILWVAHNAFFEQCVWLNQMVSKHDLPELPIHQWRCTAAKAASFSLPRDLEGVGAALNLPVQKDTDGHKVMMKLSRPRRATKDNAEKFWTPATAQQDYFRLYAYNLKDVETERFVDKALPALNEREQKIWFLDQKINFRGIALDTPAIQQTLEFIEQSVGELTTEFRNLVDGNLETPGQTKKLKAWLTLEGHELPNLQAATVDKAMKDEAMPANVKRVLQIRRSLSKISTSKYSSMLDRVDNSDGRLRDILLYCAAITKRWGGRGVQPHNFPRGTVDSDVCIETLLLGDYEWFKGCYPDVMAAYSSNIRGMCVAPTGFDIIASDLSAIEARVLPWLAGQESTLDLFRRDEDVYCTSAGNTFGRLIVKTDKYERSVGKVQELAFGYQGGIGAYGTMARAYSVDLHPAYAYLWPTATTAEQEKARLSYTRYLIRAEQAEDPDPLDRASGYAADIAKQRWRAANPEVVAFWSELERAAINAVRFGEKFYVGGGDTGRPCITFGMHQDYLLMKLPSGNCIVYPHPRVHEEMTPWGRETFKLSYKTVDSVTYQYKRTYTYGGKLAENATQAVARDILADALIRIEEAGYPVVLHVHDEIVSQVKAGTGSVKEHETLMSTQPAWASGLPLKAEGWRGKRYKK